MRLTEEEKSWFLKHARQVIAEDLLGRSMDREQGSIPEGLRMNCGVFVSLYVEGKLRGCIGTFSEERSLEENLRRMSIAAAREDHRFESILPGEVKDMQIEISVLTPRKLVGDYREIIPGRHGIYMKKESHTGTLLPQVALKQNWDLEQFLGHCARDKAGIGWNGWRDAELYTYEAYIIKS